MNNFIWAYWGVLVWLVFNEMLPMQWLRVTAHRPDEADWEREEVADLDFPFLCVHMTEPVSQVIYPARQASKCPGSVNPAYR